MNLFKKFRDDAYTLLLNKYNAEVMRSQRQSRELERLNKEVFELQQNRDEYQAASIFIDFEKMNVFSIERSFSAGRWITVIGYFHMGEVREWNLQIGKCQHEELIDNYMGYLADKEASDQLELPV